MPDTKCPFGCDAFLDTDSRCSGCNAKTKTQALDAVREAATAKAVKISCDDDYREEGSILACCVEDAQDAGCTESEIAQAQDVTEAP